MPSNPSAISDLSAPSVPAAPVPCAAWRPPVALAKRGITVRIRAVAVGGFVLADPRSIDTVRLVLLVALVALGAVFVTPTLPLGNDPSRRAARRAFLLSGPTSRPWSS